MRKKVSSSSSSSSSFVTDDASPDAPARTVATSPRTSCPSGTRRPSTGTRRTAEERVDRGVANVRGAVVASDSIATRTVGTEVSDVMTLSVVCSRERYCILLSAGKHHAIREHAC